MIEFTFKNKWHYKILKNVGYGYNLTIFKNNKQVFITGAFGCKSIAECCVRDYILEDEFNIEPTNY